MRSLFFVIYLTGAVWPIYVSERGFQEGFLGLVIGFYGFALFVSRLPIGWFCDILVEKRRFMISEGFLALALGLALPPLVDSAWSLFVSRILMGVGAGYFVAIAVLYTLYFPPRSAKASVVVAASFFGWGQIFANPAGGWLADRFDMLMPFWIAVVISIGAAILVLTIIEPDEEKNPVQRTLLPKSANLYIMAATMAVVFFAIYATVYNVTQLYASNHLQITSTTQGLLLMVFVSVFVGVVLFSPRLDSAFGSTRVITTGLAVLGLGVLLTPVGNLAVLYLAELLTGVGFGLTFGLLMALSVESIPGGQRFFAMGILPVHLRRRHDARPDYCRVCRAGFRIFDHLHSRRLSRSGGKCTVLRSSHKHDSRPARRTEATRLRIKGSPDILQPAIIEVNYHLQIRNKS